MYGSKICEDAHYKSKVLVSQSWAWPNYTLDVGVVGSRSSKTIVHGNMSCYL